MKSVIVFPGQGSQYAKMGRVLYEKYESARILYDEASEILGYDLLKACENISDELNDTNIVQPAILVYSVASWNIFKQLNQIEEVYFSGHSLGELTAAVCAEAVSFTEAIKLVKLRAALMSNCVEAGGMVVCFGLHYKEVETICNAISTTNSYVTIANYNTKNQLVLSGHRNALDRITRILEDKGATIKKLNVNIPAHSILMLPAVSAFREVLSQSQIKDSKYPIYSCITGEPYQKENEIIEHLSKQLIEGVRWPLLMDKLIHEGMNCFIEIGPQTILTKMIEDDYPNIQVYSYNELSGYDSYLKLNSKMNYELFQNSDVILLLQACLRIIVGTPIRERLEKSEFETKIHFPFLKLRKEMEFYKNNNSHISNIDVKQISIQLFSILFHKGYDRDEIVKLLELSIPEESVLMRFKEL